MTATDYCTIATVHQPTHLTIELHHVVPVAWQLAYAPATAPYPGIDQDGRGRLWDARTVALCPTHHRNVHWWIQALMHAHASGARVVRRRGGRAELAIAQQALDRFTAAGGDLDRLVALHQWGMA